MVLERRAMKPRARVSRRHRSCASAGNDRSQTSTLTTSSLDGHLKKNSGNLQINHEPESSHFPTLNAIGGVMRARTVLALCAAVLVGVPISAHDFWLAASPWAPALRVTITANLGEHFPTRDRPHDAEITLSSGESLAPRAS